MSVTYLGSLTIGDTIPGPVAAIAAALPDLTARVAALQAFAPSVTPPSFNADLTVANGIVTNLNTSIAFGLTPPTLSIQLAAVTAMLTVLEGTLAAILNIQNLFATPGVFAYAYAGRADQLGAGFTATLAAGFPGGVGADATNAVLIATTTPATWTAMGQIFKVTP